MVSIRTTNNRRRQKLRQHRSATITLFSAELKGIRVFAMSKRGAVDDAADKRLVKEGWAMPHDPDGVMEIYYNYSDLTLPGYLVGVNEELKLASPYSFAPNAIDIRGGLSDTLRQLKARITAVTA